MKPPAHRPCRNLIVVLGDQLDPRSTAWDGFNGAADVVWMAEVAEESTHVWSHKARIAYFLAAMRHFRDELRCRGVRIQYRELDDPGNRQSLSAELESAARRLRPEKLVMVEPGEWRVHEMLQAVARKLAIPLEIRPDRHFLCSREVFAEHARARKQLRMEFFYREMRRRHGILMDGKLPVGGKWNFDADNRRSFPTAGPPDLPGPKSFPPDLITREVLSLVARRFSGHPGRLERFDWPITAQQARAALEDFIRNRLPLFGPYQDALWHSAPSNGRIASDRRSSTRPPGSPDAQMALWAGENSAGVVSPRAADSPARRDTFLFHSRLSAALNLKLLDPREVLAAAEQAYREGHAPLASVEGFIRQILGWREYVRGVYWQFMPGYAEANALGATGRLPAFYWTAHTDLRCLRIVLEQTLAWGYAHHIQRLMVTGLFALLLGVRPQAVHQWYLAVYVDAVEWVELPNTLGMSQFADGGIMASKPYVASGKYIQRMSNYCAGCRYRPDRAFGADACPFTTLYWDFLDRHRCVLRGNLRMRMQLNNLTRLSATEREQIRAHARTLRQRFETGAA